jgi:Ca2+-binding RTX toxin-like protein
MSILIVIAFLAVAAMMTAGTASAHGKGCPHGQVNTIVGTNGTDFLVGTNCSDYIYGLGNNDVLLGNKGSDHLFGGRGNDRLRGVDGYPDVLSGGRGDDRCRGDQLDIFKNCEHVLRIFVTPVH